MDISVSSFMDFSQYSKKVSEELDFFSNSLVDVGNNILLTNKEIEVLKSYQINYNSCNNLKEILYLIENEILENDDNEELIEISYSISERDYYYNSNK